MKFLAVLSFVLVTSVAGAQSYNKEEPFAHTFSIVAIDTLNGEMAVGVQSHWFSVGTIVSWAKSGVGVVATQSFVNPAYGTEGIRLMEDGRAADETLGFLVGKDEGRDYRQVAIVDINSIISVYTGKKCIKYAGHKKGANYSVQANMMLNDEVIPAMSEAFEASIELPLAERVIKSMQAGQKVGGDIRGKQSAVLLVVSTKKAESEWKDKKIDLRVDDHSEPLRELERLLRVHRAYEHMNNGDFAIENGDMKLALAEYGAAEKLFPNNLEMKYWKAVALANNDMLSEALPIFKYVFEKDTNWKELTKRLPESGLLVLPDEKLQQILDL